MLVMGTMYISARGIIGEDVGFNVDVISWEKASIVKADVGFDLIGKDVGVNVLAGMIAELLACIGSLVQRRNLVYDIILLKIPNLIVSFQILLNLP
jgi:hypothetical protein